MSTKPLRIIRKNLTAAVFVVSSMIAWTLIAVPAMAQEVADGALIPLNEHTYQGTVNDVHPEIFRIIVDDHAFLLNRTLRFDDASWSREQVIQKLEAGAIVKLELDGAAEGNSSVRVVRSITVLYR